MNSLGSNEKSAYILIGILVITILGAIFYYAVYPKMEESNSLKYQIADMKKEAATLDEQLDIMKEEQKANEKSMSELKTKVPLDRDLSNVINAIEQVELVSETNVIDITFNNYDETVKETIQMEETSTNKEPQNQASSDNVNGNDESETSVTPVSPIASSSLPEKLKLISMTLSINAKDKKEIRAFLKEVEVLPRIMRIDSVEYEIPNTDVQSSGADEAHEATVQLTVFYYEGSVEE
ncbi:hypothetical protein MKZ08_05625 [Viridibacillus sp. FSL R5-0477]|uniref:Uncharacterized protein n=1 Tax=Viridibacillus arenosi FSL R5-213 TaxID=1227360 RepID=W4EQG2_9BACL|nr:hypothetical protein [Viridibacillus arenosi]ETT82464.1 hypothetical protein C176_15777 [Viridibacillus arenosi FSL R5-213]OMC92446.1 hypothetical protein BK137_05215 [Viridibacillus arenosi]